MAHIVSTTDWRHRFRDDAARTDAMRNIVLRIDPLLAETVRDDSPRDALATVVLPGAALPNVAPRTEALRTDALHDVPGRVVVDPASRAVSVELPWLDYRRGSTSRAGVDVDSIVDCRIALRRRGGARVKRAFDVIATCITAPLWLPLLGLLALVLKCTSRGPAFYAHDRVGRDGRVFRCVKLRTMAVDAERRLELLLSSDPVLRSEYEASFKLRHDPRITRFGRVLRVSGLDELPQLIAVLRGTMSLVGPRPVVSAETAYYGPYLPLVQTLRPGLTGLWQVSGRNDLAYPLRVALDVEYALTRTFWSDALTVMRTIALAFRPKRGGAY